MTDAHERANGKNRASLPLSFVVAAVAVVAGLLAAGGYFMIARLAGMTSQIGGMAARVEEMAANTEAALERAVRAEENARLAAEGRVEAERQQAMAEQVSEQARAEAAHAAEQARAAIEEAEQIRRERDEELDRLQTALGALAETQRTALGLVMNLGSDAIQFEFDRAVLRSQDRELLSRIAGVLLTARGYSIYVYGHTDDVGSDEYNISLSERRAAAVRDYLVETGIDPEIITTRGYGKSSPRVQGTAPEARAMNRRVEVGIVDVALEFRGQQP